MIRSYSEDPPWALPARATRTLTNATFSIPTHLPARPTMLVIGFTKASRDQTSAWSRLLVKDDDLRDFVFTYQAAVMDDVPGWLRRFIIRGVRGSVPESLHDRFLIVSEQSDDWKTLVSFSEPDSAYLVLLEKQRNVSWLGSGKSNATALQSLRAKVEKLKDAPDDPA